MINELQKLHFLEFTNLSKKTNCTILHQSILLSITATFAFNLQNITILQNTFIECMCMLTKVWLNGICKSVNL